VRHHRDVLDSRWTHDDQVRHGENLTAMFWCRVEARRDTLDVVSMFTVTRIPAGEIAAIEGRDGVLVCTSTGRRYGSFAYGSSVLQRWFPSGETGRELVGEHAGRRAAVQARPCARARA
jgi:hypothetical protein